MANFELSLEQKEKLKEIDFDPVQVMLTSNAEKFRNEIVGRTRRENLKKRIILELEVTDLQAENIIGYMEKGYVPHDNFSKAKEIIAALEKPDVYTDH